MTTQSIIKPPASEILKSAKILLSPAEEIGEHVTEKREELLIVLKGSGVLVRQTEKIRIYAGETYYIKENILHNIINDTDKELEYIYVVGLKQK